MKKGRIQLARAHSRTRTAWRTLAAVCAVLVALGAWQSAARLERTRSALADDDGSIADPTWEAVGSLVAVDGLTLTRFSASPLVVGWTSSDCPDVVLMEVDQGLRASGWDPIGDEGAGMLTYVHEPAALPDGREVSCAFVVIGETVGGTTSVVMELG